MTPVHELIPIEGSSRRRRRRRRMTTLGTMTIYSQPNVSIISAPLF